MEITKQLKTFIILLFIVAAGSVSAQKKIVEGSVTYYLTYELNAQQLLEAPTLPRLVTYYFRGDSSAAITNQGGATVKGISVFKANYHSLLVDIPSASKKIFVLFTPAEVEEEKTMNPQLTGAKSAEQQTVGDFKCNKVSVSDVKNNATYEIWVTNDIDLPPNSLTRPVSDFGGVPVQFVTFNGGIKITAQLMEIKEEKVPSGFFTATKDYQAMSYNDLKALGGAK